MLIGGDETILDDVNCGNLREDRRIQAMGSNPFESTEILFGLFCNYLNFIYRSDDHIFI